MLSHAHMCNPHHDAAVIIATHYRCSAEASQTPPATSNLCSTRCRSALTSHQQTISCINTVILQRLQLSCPVLMPFLNAAMLVETNHRYWVAVCRMQPATSNPCSRRCRSASTLRRRRRRGLSPLQLPLLLRWVRQLPNRQMHRQRLPLRCDFIVF